MTARGPKVLFLRSKSDARVEPRILREAKALQEFGFRVGALLWDRRTLYASEEVVEGVHLSRLRLPAPYNSPWLALLLPVFWFAAMRRSRKCDIIHACDLDTVIPAMAARRLWGKKVVFDVFDSYAGMIARRIPGFVKKFLEKAERSCAMHADFLVLPDESRAAQMNLPASLEFAVVANTLDDQPIIPFMSEHGFLLFYGGNLAPDRGIDFMHEAISGETSFQLVIAGTGPMEGVLRKRRLDAVRFLGQLPHEEVLRWSATAYALFALYDPAIPNNKFASPNKLFEAMMLAKPILVSAGTRMAEVVEKERCGLVVSYGDVEQLRSALRKLRDDAELRRELGENGRRAFLSRFTWDKQKAILLDAYKALME